MLVAELIWSEVRLRANLRNGEIIEHLLCNRDNFSDVFDIKSELAARKRELDLWREIHMDFCEECSRALGQCICR